MNLSKNWKDLLLDNSKLLLNVMSFTGTKKQGILPLLS